MNLKQIPLIWKAIGISAACAIAAFLGLLLVGSGQYNHNVPEISPVASAKGKAQPPASQAHSEPSTTQVPIAVPERRRTPRDAEFILSPSNEFQHIGPVSIRLKAAHPADQTCELVLKISNGREWNQFAKVSQPVPLVRGKRSTQLVVKQVFANSVSAYISEVSANRR